jgi:tetratricopeptide (TPR) repeat protein
LSTRRCKAGPRPAGNLLAQQRQIDKALADFDRALAINPRQADALARRGFALVHKGRTSEADVDFDRTLEFGSEWARSRQVAARSFPFGCRAQLPDCCRGHALAWKADARTRVGEADHAEGVLTGPATARAISARACPMDTAVAAISVDSASVAVAINWTSATDLSCGTMASGSR